MNAQLWKRVQELFYAASDMPPAERKEYLAGQCGSEGALLAQVESLLESSEDAANTGVSESVRLLAASAVSTAAGERIGNYEVIRELGRGGMGSVFLAVRADDQYRKQVAIKLMNVTIARPDMQARFRTERQILADLDHPNIARMLDGGSTPSGLPYVVMEYIDGVEIDVYCEERHLSLRQRLQLFRQLCDALVYAHRNLVVHRDVKPANILVTQNGTPKLLDFGIARLLGEDAGEVTRAPERLMTPTYASPEQVRGDAITTATDVYSLGVLLHQMLTGRTPLAGQRPVLDADVANIVMMAIREEPERRYSSVDQFSDDVRKYLEGFPVIARKDTLGYRSGRFLSRHRWSAAAAAVFLVTLIAFGAAMALLARRVTVERDIANTERKNSEQVAQFLMDSFALADSSGTQGRKLTADEVLERGSERIGRELKGQPAVQARIMSTIGEVYGSMGIYDRAEVLLTRAASIERSPDNLSALAHLADVKGELAKSAGLYREALSREQRPAQKAALQADYGTTLTNDGKAADAERMFNEALQARRKLFGPDSVPVADILRRLGALARTGKKLKQAETYYRQVLPIDVRLLGAEDPETVSVMTELAMILGQVGKTSEAETLLRRALVLNRRLHGESHILVAENLNALANLKANVGDYSQAVELGREAVSMYQAAVGPETPQVAIVTANVGTSLERLGRLQEAEDSIRQSLSIDGKRFGTDHPTTASHVLYLANVLRSEGKNEEAEKLIRPVIEWQRSRDAQSPMLAFDLSLLAAVKRARGDFAGAAADYEEALAIFRNNYGEAHMVFGRAMTSLAVNRMSMGDVQASEASLRRADAIIRKADHSGALDLSFTLVGLAQNLLLQGRAGEAEVLARQAYEIRRKGLPAADQRYAVAESVLGACLAALHREEEAGPLLLESHRNLLRFHNDRSLAPELARLAEFQRRRLATGG